MKQLWNKLSYFGKILFCLVSEFIASLVAIVICCLFTDIFKNCLENFISGMIIINVLLAIGSLVGVIILLLSIDSSDFLEE